MSDAIGHLRDAEGRLSYLLPALVLEDSDAGREVANALESARAAINDLGVRPMPPRWPDNPEHTEASGPPDPSSCPIHGDDTAGEQREERQQSACGDAAGHLDGMARHAEAGEEPCQRCQPHARAYWEAREIIRRRRSERQGEDEHLVRQAAELVAGSGLGSARILERKLSIGPDRAGWLIDELEALGVVGPAKGSEARDVYMDVKGLEDVFPEGGQR